MIEASPLLQPAVIQKTFALASPQQATLLLGRKGVFNTPLTVQSQPAAPADTLESVMADATGLAALAATRTRVIDNVTAHLNATIPGGNA